MTTYKRRLQNVTTSHRRLEFYVERSHKFQDFLEFPEILQTILNMRPGIVVRATSMTTGVEIDERV